ncbi:MAG: enoyl-CoA hydratase/isomerase family protein [Planctomycetes bacterium]|nr:enoyl-CoA hydratase/isomerase family protein [Planctomycetota bacterium]
MPIAVRVEIDAEGVATVWFDAPGRSVNTFTAAVLDEFSGVIEQVEALARDKKINGVVFASAKPGVFITGADLAEMMRYDASGMLAFLEKGQGVLERIARLPVVTVAAINGHCLGGGFELALACTYRVAADEGTINIGLPEVKLGMIPAWGGTTRVTRMIGLRRALPLLISGESLTPRKAKTAGLIDEVAAPEQLMKVAKEMIGRGPRTPLEPPAEKQQLLDTPTAMGEFCERERRAVLAETFGHYPAMLGVIDVAETAAREGHEEGLRAERERLAGLSQTAACKNLLRMFFLRQSVKKAAQRTSPGQITSEILINRLLVSYVAEALAMARETGDIARIDVAMRRWGMGMGPFEWCDQLGLDAVLVIFTTIGESTGSRAPTELTEIAERGWLGRKSGRGFYVYDGETMLKNGDALALLRSEGGAENVPDDETIQWRLVLPMVNEAVRLLEAGVVASPDTVDVASVLGFGFPAFRGGLMHYARSVGVEEIERRMNEWAERWGERFRPAPGLRAILSGNEPRP